MRGHFSVKHIFPQCLTATLAETYNSRNRIYVALSSEMKISYRSTSGRNRTLFSRVLACALLIGIIYSSTFGVVHSHGNVSPTLDTNISVGFTGQAGASSEVPFHSRTDGKQCLICVLHQQFSSSTVYAPLFIAGPSTQITRVSAPAAFHRSNPSVSSPIARLSGRAPPIDRR